MKKFVTTKTPTASAPSPTPKFSFEAMLRAANCSTVPITPRTPETVDAVALPPSTPSAIVSEAAVSHVPDTEPFVLLPPPPGTKDSGRSPSGRVPTASSGATPQTSTGVVKMCGYLKKKRNKMGGWRKMFFILQNQLLLSYSSRKDYERKLAPFKDIINLGPGTTIIPTTGPRFNIETNSKVMYTFRCDDQQSRSQWITALLDSLHVVNGGITDRNLSLHNALSTLTPSKFPMPTRTTRFGSSATRPSPPEDASAMNLPAERSGPPKPPRSFGTDVQRRHQPSGAEPIDDRTIDDPNNNGLAQQNNAKSLASPSPSSSRDDGQIAGPEGDDDKRPTEATDEEPGKEGDDGERANQLPPAPTRKGPKPAIFRLHQDVWSKPHQSVDVCRINSMFNERPPSTPTMAAEQRKVPEPERGQGTKEDATADKADTAESQPYSIVGARSSCNLYEDIDLPEVDPVPVPGSAPEPIYAVVDVRAKRSRRLARQLSSGPDGEDRDGRAVSVSLPQIPVGDGGHGVDAARGRPRRPGTARSCSNYDDYEDVNYLFEEERPRGPETDSVATEGSQEAFAVRDGYCDEHIYEPILVQDRLLPLTVGSSSSLPGPSDHHGLSSSLWRHLKRMQLHGSSRRRFGFRKASPGTDQPPDSRSPTVAALEGLGRRLDSHRRSIKKRIKSLCDRIDPVSSSASTVSTTSTVPAADPEPAPGLTETTARFECGPKSRKSLSLDSFLLASNQTSSQRC